MRKFTFLAAVICIAGMALTAEAGKSLNGLTPLDPDSGTAGPGLQAELTETKADQSLIPPTAADFTPQNELPAVFSNGSLSVVSDKVEYREPVLNLGTPALRGTSSDSQALRRKQTKKKLIVGAVLNAALVTVVTSMMNASGNQVKVGAAGI